MPSAFCQLSAHTVKELTFGDKPFFPFPDLEEDLSSESSSDLILEALTVHPPEYGSSIPSSTPNILLPNLESLEANGGYIITDKYLCRILTSRIDAAQRGLTSPLRRVKVQFARKKKEDTVPEIVPYARGRWG